MRSSGEHRVDVELRLKEVRIQERERSVEAEWRLRWKWRRAGIETCLGWRVDSRYYPPPERYVKTEDRAVPPNLDHY